jgi:hypothetical protein
MPISTARRWSAGLAAGVLTAGLGAVATVPAGAAPAPASTPLTGVELTWGVSGYAQVGAMGAWRFEDLTGDASLLAAGQDEYVVDPVPATSMPDTGSTPTAVQFAGGTGTLDPATGAVEVSWDGSYTQNGYPAMFNAPDEVFADPELTISTATGAGELTMDVTIGAATDREGNQTPAVELGRITVATFDAGSAAPAAGGGYRLTPDYQGVVNGIEGQDSSCTTADGATGWWGSWPLEYVSAVPESIRPHYYSTGCGGKQDNKPALPIDISFAAAPDAPSVTVSETRVDAEGTTTVTVQGEDFDPAAATGARPPVAGRPAGTYVVFGRFAERWQPSQGAASDARPVASQLWALPPGSLPEGTPGVVELTADGSFTAQLEVSKAAADALATTGRYGIYTYAGGGAVAESYETYTPITFTVPSKLAVSGFGSTVYGKARTATVTVSSDGDAAGTVQVLEGRRVLAASAVTRGTVRLALPRRLAVGRHQLDVVFSGTGSAADARRPAVLRVTRAGSTLRATPRRSRVAAGTPARVKVTLGSKVAGVPARGAVTVRVAGREPITVAVPKGSRTVTLRGLTKGRHVVQVRFAGSATHKPATARTVVRVVRRSGR